MRRIRIGDLIYLILEVIQRQWFSSMALQSREAKACTYGGLQYIPWIVNDLVALCFVVFLLSAVNGFMGYIYTYSSGLH